VPTAFVLLRYSIARNIQNFRGFVLILFIALCTCMCNYILIPDYKHSFNLSIKNNYLNSNKRKCFQYLINFICSASILFLHFFVVRLRYIEV